MDRRTPNSRFCFGFIAYGSIRQTAVNRPHRNSTSPRFSASRPHCVIPLMRGCGWTEVSLSLRMCRRLKCNQHLFTAWVLTARILPLSNLQWCGYWGCGLGVPAIWLSFSGHTGNVPDKTLIQFSRYI